jgi:hypothetical protein
VNTMTEQRSKQGGFDPMDQFANRANGSYIAAEEQRRAALKAANEKRSAMARLKSELKTLPTMEARAVVAEVIESNQPMYGSLRVEALLRAIQGWGITKAERIVKKCGIPGKARIDELDDDSRADIIAILRGPRRV